MDGEEELQLVHRIQQDAEVQAVAAQELHMAWERCVGEWASALQERDALLVRYRDKYHHFRRANTEQEERVNDLQTQMALLTDQHQSVTNRLQGLQQKTQAELEESRRRGDILADDLRRSQRQHQQLETHVDGLKKQHEIVTVDLQNENQRLREELGSSVRQMKALREDQELFRRQAAHEQNIELELRRSSLTAAEEAQQRKVENLKKAEDELQLFVKRTRQNWQLEHVEHTQRRAMKEDEVASRIELIEKRTTVCEELESRVQTRFEQLRIERVQIESERGALSSRVQRDSTVLVAETEKVHEMRKQARQLMDSAEDKARTLVSEESRLSSLAADLSSRQSQLELAVKEYRVRRAELESDIESFLKRQEEFEQQKANLETERTKLLFSRSRLEQHLTPSTVNRLKQMNHWLVAKSREGHSGAGSSGTTGGAGSFGSATTPSPILPIVPTPSGAPVEASISEALHHQTHQEGGQPFVSPKKRPGTATATTTVIHSPFKSQQSTPSKSKHPEHSTLSTEGRAPAALLDDPRQQSPLKPYSDTSLSSFHSSNGHSPVGVLESGEKAERAVGSPELELRRGLEAIASTLDQQTRGDSPRAAVDEANYPSSSAGSSGSYSHLLLNGGSKMFESKLLPFELLQQELIDIHRQQHDEQWGQEQYRLSITHWWKNFERAKECYFP